MSYEKKIAVIVFFLGFFCLPSHAEPSVPAASASLGDAPVMTRRADLDGDGSKEAVIYEQGKIITKVVIDKDHDGKADAVIYYRKGFRDYAEIDANRDGKIDTVILYYFTGVPAMISFDRNADEKPDRWTFFKNGIIYKREWDRNFDGLPDYRILFSTKSDFRSDANTQMQSFTKQYDNNNDGVFEVTVKGEKRSSPKRLSVTVGSLSEEHV